MRAIAPSVQHLNRCPVPVFVAALRNAAAAHGLGLYTSSNKSPDAVGICVMELEDETIGLRTRLERVRAAIRFIDDPLAIALLQSVIADIETRIAAVESSRQPSDRG
jgi:hypothetical protein